MTIVRILHLRSLAKQRIGFIKQQNYAPRLRRIKHPPQILLGFANVFAHHRTQINPVQV
jgi:hypothetical protein